MAFPIDVGNPATDRGSFGGGANTRLSLDNPANLSGLITSIDVWANTDITGFRIGTFFLVAGTTYRCRSSATIGNVVAGAKRTFPVSIPVQKGDFIGWYLATGALEVDVAGGGGIYTVAGEYIDPGDQAIFALIANAAFSLYGQGIVRGWCSK